MTSRRAVLRGGAALGAAGLAGCVGGTLDAEETIAREFDGNDLSAVDVETVNGDVEIGGADDETIRLEGQKAATDEDSLADVTLASRRDGDALSLAVEIDDGFLSFGPSGRMDLALDVPAALAIGVGTTNGDVTIDVPSPGEVTVDTTNGDVEVAMGEPADVTVDTTNGDVTVALPPDAEPTITFDTTNGDLEVSGLAAGPLESGGSIQTTIGAGTHRIEVETTNGDLAVRGR